MMSAMTKEQLLDSLASYGYPLLLPKDNEPEEVLENLSRQEDHRLLEGFPVVFLSALQSKEPLEWEGEKWQPEKLPKKARTQLLYLVAVSCLLFERYQVEKTYTARALKLLHKLPNGRELSRKAFKELAEANTVHFGGTDFSFERYRNTFETYVVWSAKKQSTELKKHSLEQELLLSEIFTPRQKVLLRKKLDGQKLTKTEREYFSRVVKKRLRVLANDDLHQLANHALQQ